jgi:predicted HNH restriction endonuclease
MPVDEAGFPEGRKKFILHTIRERDSQVIKDAKEAFKKKHNRELFCEVCGFNFENISIRISDYRKGANCCRGSAAI